jgi:hypothetical protein
MDPRLDAIVTANARWIRTAADLSAQAASKAAGKAAAGKAAGKAAAQIAALQDELDHQCRLAVADLGPAAGGAARLRPEQVAAFMRYLLRNMDLRERLGMLESAREVGAFMDRLRLAEAQMANAPPPASRQAAAADGEQLRAVLGRLGAHEVGAG